MKKSIFVLLFLALGCSTAQQPAPAAKPKSQFRNLQVLAPDIEREKLIETISRLEDLPDVSMLVHHLV